MAKVKIVAASLFCALIVWVIVLLLGITTFEHTVALTLPFRQGLPEGAPDLAAQLKLTFSHLIDLVWLLLMLAVGSIFPALIVSKVAGERNTRLLVTLTIGALVAFAAQSGTLLIIYSPLYLHHFSGLFLTWSSVAAFTYIGSKVFDRGLAN